MNKVPNYCAFVLESTKLFNMEMIFLVLDLEKRFLMKLSFVTWNGIFLFLIRLIKLMIKSNVYNLKQSDQ